MEEVPKLAKGARRARADRTATTGEGSKLTGWDRKTVRKYLLQNYRAPEETAAAIDAEGWFNTRDLARLEEGNPFIVGCTKDAGDSYRKSCKERVGKDDGTGRRRCRDGVTNLGPSLADEPFLETHVE
jgi:hypothetical protein